MSRTMDAVLFDYGGVFTDSPFAAIEKLGTSMGAAPGLLMKIIFGPYGDNTDHPWHQLERGEITLTAARETIISLGKEHGLDTDIYKFFTFMGGSGGIRESFVELVRDLKAAGYKTGMITNNVLEFREHWVKTLPIDELFDSVVDSSEVGLRKPDPAIFLHTLAELEVAPERAIFLDDFEGNIIAARATGLHAILVNPEYHGAIEEVRRLTE
ncbi:MAG: HAD family phosphatase [Deltaproteobacteria bacterium]